MELSLKDVVNELNPVAPKYFCIGLNLDVPGDKIRTIESNHTETNRRFLEVLISIWMKGRRELVTWERLIKALEAPSVDEQSLADKVRNKIYTPANSQGTEKLFMHVRLFVLFMTMYYCVHNGRQYKTALLKHPLLHWQNPLN